MQHKWGLLGMWVVSCLGVGFLGSFVTMEAIPDWYETLIKPSFAPPNWVFGPVWTVLYILMGVAAWRVSVAKVSAKQLWALRFFVSQLALNFAWSWAFFGLRSPLYGLITIAALWLLIGLTMVTFWRVDRLAAWLLGPYLVWVTFAAVLNAGLLSLNP